MDIRSFTRKDTATVPIQDPLGGKTDIVVEVYGRDSKAYRAAALEIGREMQENEPLKEGEDGDKVLAERGAKLLQACIASWKNVEADGKAIKPDSDEALTMLKDESLDWFVSQISVAIQKRSLFFTKSGKS
jgi:hypothetical protein